MATIRKRTISRHGRKRASYQVQIRIQGYPQLTQSFHNLDDARLWATTTEADIRLGRAVPEAVSASRSFGEAVRRYLETVLPRKAKETAEHQVAHLRWWEERLGGVQIDQVTRAMVVEIRESLAANRSAATVNRYMAALSGLYRTAIGEWEWAKTNPCHGVRRLTEAPGRLRFLDEAELPRLLDACRRSADPRLLPAVAISVGTGMRRGELLGMTWSGVDFQERLITISTTKNRDPRGIPMSAEVASAFLRLRLLSDGDGAIFHGLPVDWPRIPFRDALRDAGISDCRWHDLRHTAASHMAMRGVPLRTIGEILGHRAIAMTLRYSHLSRRHLREALDGLGQAIGGAENG